MNRIFGINLFLILTLNSLIILSQNVDPWEVRCHVCKVTMYEMEDAIAKENPNKIAQVSGFRINSDGDSVTKTVKLTKSEVYLTDLMETVCKKMDDYAKAIHKKTGRLNVIKMIGSDGTMNSEISSYDFVQDGDLNKSLEHYCLEILEDHEDKILKHFMGDNTDYDIDFKLCSEQAKYCKDDIAVEEDYKLEDEL